MCYTRLILNGIKVHHRSTRILSMKPLKVLEQTKFWHDPQLGDLELLRATYFTFAFAPHTHDTYAFGVTEAGAQLFTHHGAQRRIMPAGSVAVVHPGEVHTSQAVNDQGWSYRMFYPGAGVVQGIAAELSGKAQDLPFFPSPVIMDGQLAWHIQNFHRLLEDPSTSVLERESGLRWVLGLLLLHYSADPVSPCTAAPEPGYVERIREYIDEHYAEHMLLEQLAGLVGLSCFHLLRIFRSTTGLTPHAYQTHLRIEHAKELLRKGGSSADVAVEVGFVDQSHFCKRFKRMVGIAPGQYC